MFYEVWILKTKRQSTGKMLTKEMFCRVCLYTILHSYVCVCVCVCACVCARARTYMHLSICVRHTVNTLYIIFMHFSYLLTISAG
jgi:hypothetical protein